MVFEGAKHDNLLDVIVVDCIPEVAPYGFKGCLCEDSVDLLVDY